MFDIKIRGLFEIKKNDLIEKLKTYFSKSHNGKDDKFTRIWNDMKKRNNFIENDKFLRIKIEEYIKQKDGNSFLNDLKEQMKATNIIYLNIE